MGSIIQRILSICVLACFVTAGCTDRPQFLIPPKVHELSIVAILDPDLVHQPVLVTPLMMEAGQVPILAGAIYHGDTLIASGPPFVPPIPDYARLERCLHRYGSIIGSENMPQCVTFGFTPHFGSSYRLVIAAEGRPAASGVAHVPGDFKIINATAAGDPLGSRGVHVLWTLSSGAYRYMIMLRPTHMPGPDEGYRYTWFAVTADTVLNTKIPSQQARYLIGARGPWYVEVIALDKAAYQYVTTGLDDDFFPVPPAQNVHGGYGVVGAWVHRTIQLEQ